MIQRRCRVCRFRGEPERCPKCGAACDPIPPLPRRSGTMAAIAGFIVALESSARPPMDYTTEAALRADPEGR